MSELYRSLRDPDVYEMRCMLDLLAEGGPGQPPFLVSVEEPLLTREEAANDPEVRRMVWGDMIEAGGRIEGSHDDYSRPLDVEWLCRPCHMGKDGLV